MTDMKMGIERLQIVIPDLRQPKYQHLYHDPKLRGMSQMAKDYAVEMAYAQYTEQAILNGMFGNCVGAVRTTIAAGATAQTTLATGPLATPGSGNMDQTPNTAAWVFTGHPGSSNTTNTFTAIQALKLTGSAATSLTFASQSIATAITSADAIFVGGSASAGGAIVSPNALGFAQQLYIGLSTQAFSGATQANVLTGEPAIGTNAYSRIGTAGSTPANLYNTQVNFPIATAATPSVLTTANGPWSFPASTGAWASSSNLQTMFFCDEPTGTTAGTNVNILAIGQLGTAQAVAASGITLSFANAAITLTLT